ncbi:MAG: DUF4438 domain-containing protein [Bacillota bacterium]|nr:DUF4438 domain-containing protein [Bacillota bacterium]
MLKINKDRLPIISVLGEISAPGMRTPYRTGFDGVSRVVAGTGGITYNARIGDPALGWVGDHVEPAVSSKNKDENSNSAYNTLSCVGNVAYVVDGAAKGAKGYVTGTHGGIEHVLIDFAPEILEKLVVGDKIQVRATGQGLEIEGFPGIKCMNLDPDLFLRMGAKEAGDGVLEVPVAAIVPAELMGSGIGAATAERGDYDITTQDADALREHGLENLRFGDIVAVRDRSSFYGRSYRKGAIEIGVVVHSDSKISGHGPGVTTLLTANRGEIRPVLDAGANIAFYLGVREP